MVCVMRSARHLVGSLIPGLLVLGFSLGFTSAAQAQQPITIGMSATATGPNAPIGIPAKNTLEMMPKTLAGQPVRVIVLDDGGDPGAAVRNFRKLASEDNMDVYIGSTSTPTSLATMDVANETKIPQLALAPITWKPEQLPWVFMVPQPAGLMVEGVVAHMKANNVKTVGFIGFSDGWGELNLQAINRLAATGGYKIVATERYARNDTSVSAQILKIIAANPDAVYIGASTAPAALPHIALKERGYKGRVYHSPAVINPDFLRVGGKNVEGGIAPTGPIAVADQLPESNPIRQVALDFKKTYDAKYGAGSSNPFGGYAWDGVRLVEAAIPIAIKKAKPGTAEFRAAMREAIEGLTNVVGTHAVYNMTKQDHNGVDERSRVMVRVENCRFQVIK
jgi:branched-chain amino acid transport system substrate-binding protein